MFRSRRRALFLITGAVLIVPALLLSLLGLKLLRDFTRTTRDLQAEYGDYVARLAVTALEDALWEQEQLNLVAARVDPPQDPMAVVGYLNRAQLENVLYETAFFVSPVGLVHYSSLRGSSRHAFRPLPAWIKEPIDAALARQHGVPSGLQHITSPDSLPPVQVTYFTVNTVSGELLGAAGFVWDLDALRGNREFLSRVLTHDVQTNAEVFQARFFQSMPAITLLDENEQPFFTTFTDAVPEHIAVRSFRNVLPFYRVSVQMTDDRFDAGLEWVERTYLALIVAMLLVIVLAVIFSFRFVIHEVELAELKSSLVSNVSHELKTPLALIRLFAETVEMGRAGSEEKEKEFLRVIGRESERLTHLINNVLDVGRIETGGKAYRIELTDLAQVVRETLDAYRFQLQQKGFTLESRIEEIPPVPADPEAVTQALLNLVDNAIKYSADARHVEVGLHQRNGEAVISVEDRGVGIPAPDQDKIFEKFYRVQKGLIHDVKGSGLGLALVKHIVEAHGGRITVTSRPGEGSRFSIHLPMVSPGGKTTQESM